MANTKNLSDLVKAYGKELDRAELEQAGRTFIGQVSALASLSLTEAEGDKLALELVRILGFLATLDEVPTSNVPPTAQVVALPAANALRADEVKPCLSHDDALAQAPRAAQGGFAVPGFVEGAS